MDRSDRHYWDGLAARWTVRPPLAPSPEDLAWFARRLGIVEGYRPARALLLGTTPGLAALPWRPGSSVLALDWSHPMLRRMDGCARVARVCADWRRIPLASSACGIIVGDGCYTAIGSRTGAVLLSQEMHRVLAAQGVLLLRCFVRPEDGERIEELVDQALSGAPVPADLFRWRLAMAVQGNDRWGVRLQEVWEAWTRIPERALILERQRWTAQEMSRFEHFREEQARYAFPSLSQLADLASPWFAVEERHFGQQAFAERFPMLALRRRG